MVDPISLEQMDQLLNRVCNDLNEAAVRSELVGEANARIFKRLLGDALVRVWDARDYVFALRPELKPELVRAADEDPEACRQYFDALRTANRLALAGQNAAAAEVMQRFAELSPSAAFAQIAHAKASAFQNMP